MTKTELEKQIAEMQEQFNKIQKQLEELKQVKVEETSRKRWKPELNEVYYFVGDSGFVSSCSWDNDERDNWRYLNGNVFETEQEAEEHKKKLEIQARFRNFVEEKNEKIDWNDDRQKKFFLYYTYYDKMLLDCYECMYKSQGTIYASSEQILRDAIAEIGENSIKKYVLEVEDE